METVSRSSEILNKETRHIYTEEFAQRVNTLAGDMPDEQRIAPLAKPWWGVFPTYDETDHTAPNPAWSEFMESLPRIERVYLCRLLHNVSWGWNISTIGELRVGMAQSGSVSRVSPRGKAFGHLAFRKRDPQENLSAE